MIIASLYPCPFDPQDRHDPSCSIITSSGIYAYEEDKLTSIKNDPTVRFPERSLMMGLKQLNILPSEVNFWVFPEPSIRPAEDNFYLFFSWILKAYLGTREQFSDWFNNHVRFVKHHLSHAALAVYTSPYTDCNFITQDGGGDGGDFRDFTFGYFSNGDFQFLRERSSYNNICSFHSFITDAIGFSGGEQGKTGGLAAYGNVNLELLNELEKIFYVHNEEIIFERKRIGRTSVRLSKIKPQEYNRAKIFNEYPSLTNVYLISRKYLPQDIAATGEFLVQKNFLTFVTGLLSSSPYKHTVFSGGLFQNVGLNSCLREKLGPANVHIPMSPADGGLSLGAALLIANELPDINLPKTTSSFSPFIGPSFSYDEISDLLHIFNLKYTAPTNLSHEIAKLIADGNIIGIFHGRGEYGPRSLGSRSIIADPRSKATKSRLNQTLKRRDWFMPYAPAILSEKIDEWLEVSQNSPYMQFAPKIKPHMRDLIPAAVHTDGSARVQSVEKELSPFFWKIINDFNDITGIPIVLNTSFNRHGISTISSPRQAIEHLLQGCVDYLVIENVLICSSENRIFFSNSEKEQSYLTEDELLKLDCIKRLEFLESDTSISFEEIGFFKNALNELANQ
jgi:carbamoyltransferase